MKIKLLSILFTLITAISFANSAQPLRRFALFIGSNNGGHDRILLRYAESDAQAMAQVLQEVGGLATGDSLVLLAPTASDLRFGFDQIQQRIALSKDEARRVEFVLYYSGHSDEKGILLGEELVSYQQLKDDMLGIEADVNIAILDSCSSGAFTRLKGGTRRASFLLDESVQMKGHAFLTSSSADEAAQESDAISASFFTHYLISGLRGAADVTQDGQITLNEAYHFAFSETLSRTENTQGGAQHPSYNIQLTGTGDLTLTDLRSTSAGIVVEEGVQGRLFIRDGRGQLMVELQKNADMPITLALPAGRYDITLKQEGNLYQTTVQLYSRGIEQVAMVHFASKSKEQTTLRGSDPEPELRSEPDIRTTLVPFNISLGPFSPFGSGDYVVHNFSLNLLIGDTYAVYGTEIGPLINIVHHEISGAELAGIGNILTGTLHGTQLAGVFNMVTGIADGYLGAGVFNIVEGSGTLAQTAGVFNINTGSFSGFQGAGVFNLTDDSFKGAQAGGVFNIVSDSIRGAQLAGIFNIAEGDLSGTQLAGVFNVAEKVSGLQAGLFNMATKVEGAQVGLINVSKGVVKGTQIGLFNFAREIHGIPIGLLTITTDGFHVSSWYNESGLAYFGFQTGNRYTYTLISAGIKPSQNPLEYLVAGVGLGLRLPVGPFYFGADASAKYVFQDFSSRGIADSFAPVASPVFPSARFYMGVELFELFSIFAGVTLDVYLPGLTQRTVVHQGYDFELNSGEIYYPKIFVGIQL